MSGANSLSAEDSLAAELRWIICNGVTGQAIWRSTSPAIAGYIETPVIGACDAGQGWKVRASGLNLIIRLVSSPITRNGMRQYWPHFEVFEGEYHATKLPILVWPISPADIGGLCEIKGPTISSCNTLTDHQTWVIKATGMNLGLRLVFCNPTH